MTAIYRASRFDGDEAASVWVPNHVERHFEACFDCHLEDCILPGSIKLHDARMVRYSYYGCGLARKVIEERGGEC